MKKINQKIIFIFFLLYIFITPVKAEEQEVKFNACVDGDTIKVSINEEIKTVRFLAIDTPETKHPKRGIEPYGKEASTYTCNKVKNAKKLVLEYDDSSTKIDKYDRLLAWIWVDDSLLQKELINTGYAKVAYLYDDYKYTDELQRLEKIAQTKEIGIWQSEKQDLPTYVYIIIILVILGVILLVPKYRKKALNKAKKDIKKSAKKTLNKYMNKVLK